MLTYEEVLNELRANGDPAYRAFHKRLLKDDTINVIGVRMPVLRALAKRWQAEWRVLLTFADDYYEVTFLKCAVVGKLPYEEFTEQTDGVVALIDNWATCDCFTAPCIQSHREEFLPYIERFLSDERVFVRRFALVTLLHYYVQEEYLPFIFSAVCRCGEEYYVSMAAAWLAAEVVVRFYSRGVAFLGENRLPAETHNRAIQKARESRRLTEVQKAELKAMKREMPKKG